MALSVWSLMNTCLIDVADPARTNGPESRRFDVLDIGANGWFSKVCGHFAGLASGNIDNAFVAFAV
ncbi:MULTISPECIES: hypothetical protein [Mesorhizobium]|uniref:Uncharacterized protein n=1 Tax=Mesorhizobium shonense TaxID=1209948 RepID=A0ABV2HUM6_9HYPH|nr:MULTISPECIES: hypothetical protein [unclassified Mesorhizobium]AZO26397.1 hypothetical protein EJ071_02075 [Mesorhizobium sp. M1B.F.Ca.ET.045.04.1.1]RWE03830.1 MAG: hypothetical protein EOS40_01555 [Mesorhizobium sp.]